jgi:ribonuclease HII
MLNLIEEENLFKEGCRFVGALDEAGRGPLVGPVVAACVVIDPEFILRNVDNKDLAEIRDSKKLSTKKREFLFEVIKKEFIEVGIGICDHETIDRVNILEATFLAMKKALGSLKQKPDFILVDGKFPISNLSLRQKPIINGDNLVFSIAAASIIAKVTRDRLMEDVHKAYPQYGFNKHKGYGTKLHMECLKKYGPCPFHRKSFSPVSDYLKDNK